MRKAIRLRTLTPDNEPLWVLLCVYPVGDNWAARLGREDGPLPGPD